ncbi:MAG: acyl-CoA dehydratase activase [Candidatus Sigynarchaeota archaeon]
MLYCGIDVGSTTCKALVIDDSRNVLATSMQPVGGNPDGAVDACLDGVLKVLKAKRKAITRILLTGRNCAHVSGKDRRESDLKCLGAGAFALAPSTRTAIDTGSFTNKVIRMDARGRIVDYQTNDKCAAGAGMFLELVCKSLDLSIDEIGAVALSAKNPVPVTSQCSIFAESEVIYLMNEGVPIPDIAAGACISVVGRLIPLMAKVGVERDVVITGGVGKNVKVIQALEEHLGMKMAACPLDPQFVSAFGAATIALEGA